VYQISSQILEKKLHANEIGFDAESFFIGLLMGLLN